MQRKIWVIIGFSILTAVSAFAHPHTFINQKIRICSDDKGISGFNIHWEFDEMFSSMIIGDYDVNRNQILEKNEVAVIKDKAFSYLSNFHYFIHIKIDNKPFDVNFVKGFAAKIKNKILIYEFFVPCHVSAGNTFKQIIVATYDPSYYSAIFFSKQGGAGLDKTGYRSDKYEVKFSVKEDKSTKIYFDTINPMALFLEFKIKK